MENADLNAETFKALNKDDSRNFLLFDDATSEIQKQYADIGLCDAAGNQRIARVVTLQKGFRLFKLTHYNTLLETMSSWWSSVAPFEENDMGAKEVFEAALLNGVSLRELVRFISAVSLDWNLLDYYVEIKLCSAVKAYWGQFTPQAGIQNRDKKIDGVGVSEEPSPGGDNTMIQFDTSNDPDSEVFLPDILGGYGAWQFYVPNFQKAYIDASAVVIIQSTDDRALAKHFGVSAVRMDALLNQRQAWKDAVSKGKSTL